MTTRRPSDEAAIRTLIEGRVKALRAKDVRGVRASQAADFVHFSLAPPLQSGTEPEGLAAWFSTWQGPLRYEIHGLEVAAAGDVAFCHGFSRLAGTKVEREEVEVWFRTTFGLRKRDDAWTIVHEHESVPFYMDGSLRAAVDLKP